MSPNKPPPYNYSYRLPADLKHAVSLTTLKVLEGGKILPLLTRHAHELKSIEKETAVTEIGDETKQPYCAILHRPIVKKDVQTDAQWHYEKPTLDISLPHVCLLSLWVSFINDKI